MTTPYDYLDFATTRLWEEWLAQNHVAAQDAWLRIAKKSAPTASITIIQALDGALCYGWIDGQRKGLDEHYCSATRLAAPKVRGRALISIRPKHLLLLDVCSPQGF